MNTKAFRQLFEYHFSENRKLWENYIVGLSQDQFLKENDYSIGSLRDQIVHLIEVDEIWFCELQGIEPSESLEQLEDGDSKCIRDRWDSLEQDMRHYLAGLQDEMLFSKPISAPEEDQELMVWQVLFHVVNHATDHRAQILKILSDMGVRTTSQDYIFYVYENLNKPES